MDDSLNGSTGDHEADTAADGQADFKRRAADDSTRSATAAGNATTTKSSATSSPPRADDFKDDGDNSEPADVKVATIASDDRKAGLLEALKAADADADLDDYLLDEVDDDDDDDVIDGVAELTTLTNDDEAVVSGDVDEDDEVDEDDDDDVDDDGIEDIEDIEDTVPDCASSVRGSDALADSIGGRPVSDATAYLADLLAERTHVDVAKCPNAERLLDAEITKVQTTGRVPHRDAKYVDIYREKPIRVVLKVLVPVKEHPKFNFVGKLLGPRGNSLKRLQEDTMCKMAVLGRGSMRDRNKEEELRCSSEPKYAHLHDELHVEISAQAPPAEAHARAAYALAEVRKYLIPDANDGIRQEQLRELIGTDGTTTVAAVASEEDGHSHHHSHQHQHYAPLSSHHYAPAASHYHHHHHPHQHHQQQSLQHNPYQSFHHQPLASASPSAALINPYARPRAIASAYATAAQLHQQQTAATAPSTHQRSTYASPMYGSSRAGASHSAPTTSPGVLQHPPAASRSAMPPKKKILDRARHIMDAYEAADSFAPHAAHAYAPHAHHHSHVVAHAHHPHHPPYAQHHYAHHHHHGSGVHRFESGAASAAGASTPSVQPPPAPRFEHAVHHYVAAASQYDEYHRHELTTSGRATGVVKHTASATSSSSSSGGYHHNRYQHHSRASPPPASGRGGASGHRSSGSEAHHYRSEHSRGGGRGSSSASPGRGRGSSHHYHHEHRESSGAGGDHHHSHGHQYSSGSSGTGHGGSRYRSAPYSKPSK